MKKETIKVLTQQDFLDRYTTPVKLNPDEVSKFHNVSINKHNTQVDLSASKNLYIINDNDMAKDFKEYNKNEQVYYSSYYNLYLWLITYNEFFLRETEAHLPLKQYSR